LARAVRSDDCADPALVDIEADIAERLHAAERKRDILHGEDHIADLAPGLHDLGRGALVHAARRSAAGKVFTSRISTAALMRPRRPSSKRTSVSMLHR